jgi:hypothetical protein
MKFASFANSPPILHSWDQGETWNSGGFSPYHLHAIYNFCRKSLAAGPRVIETGAGNSTICFLHLEPTQVISIAPDKALFDRITAYCQTNDISTQPLTMHIDGSEWVLPKLAADSRNGQLDLALIDGCHNWPMVMVDFFYVNLLLKKGGYLMLDDIQLHSVAELYRLISYETKTFRPSANLGKLWIFEKLTSEPQFGEWNTQTYIAALSGVHTAPLVHRLISAVISAKNIKQKWLEPILSRRK